MKTKNKLVFSGCNRAIFDPAIVEEDSFGINDIFTEKELSEFVKIQKDVLESYTTSTNIMPEEDWLLLELQKQLPEKKTAEIRDIRDGIINSLRATEDMRKSQLEAFNIGRGSESWLKSVLLKTTSKMPEIERVKYLQNIDKAVSGANNKIAEMLNLSTDKTAAIPPFVECPVERECVDSFNLNAQGSADKASNPKVAVPKAGIEYGEDSAEVIIKDADGNIIRRYQIKIGNSVQETITQIKESDYCGHRVVVPEEQVKEVQEAFPDKKISSTISVDEIESTRITNKFAEKLQRKIQSGETLLAADWKMLDSEMLATSIGKEVGMAGLMGASACAVIVLASKVWKKEKIVGYEIIKKALESGADFGIKSATACALKVAAENGILSCIPKGTPAGTIANIAFIAIEDVKIFSKIASHEISLTEGVRIATDATCSTVGGFVVAAQGMTVGAEIGTVLGPVGTLLGGLAGGGVGYIVGSKLGKELCNTAKEFYVKAQDALKITDKISQQLKEKGLMSLSKLSAQI